MVIHFINIQILVLGLSGSLCVSESAISDSTSLSLQCSEVYGQRSGRVAVWRANERKGRGDALSDIRGGGAVETGSVGQWVTGPGEHR